MDRNDQILAAALLSLCLGVGLTVVARWQGAGNAAEWAGSIGVVGAIFGSAKIAQWQYAKSRGDETRRHSDAETLRIVDILRFSFQIQMFLERLRGWAAKGAQGRLPADDTMPDHAVVLSKLLGDIDIMSLPDFTFIQLLAELRGEMSRIACLMNDEVPAPNAAPYYQANRVAAADVAERAIARCIALADAGREYFARGGPYQE